VRVSTMDQARNISTSDPGSDFDQWNSYPAWLQKPTDDTGYAWWPSWGWSSTQSYATLRSTLRINTVTYTAYPADTVPLAKTYQRTYNYSANSNSGYSTQGQDNGLWSTGQSNSDSTDYSNISSNFTIIDGMSGSASYHAASGSYNSSSGHHASGSSSGNIWGGLFGSGTLGPYSNSWTDPNNSDKSFSASTTNGDPVMGSDGKPYYLSSLTAETVDVYGSTITNQNFKRGFELDGDRSITKQVKNNSGKVIGSRTDSQSIKTEWYKCTKNYNGDWTWTLMPEGI